MSVGMLFWLTYQGMWNYFEVLKRQDVPDPFLGDIVLFLHLVPMIAALAVLPHLREDERDERIRMLDFTLLLIWWVFVYVYAVIPWQTVQVDEATYSANFNFAYLTEKLVLLVALAILAYTAHGGWRQRLRTVARRQCTLRLQFLCRQLGHRSQDLLQRQHLRHSADRFHRLDGRGSLARSPPRSLRLQAVAACARRLDHTPQHARSVQPALGRPARRTGPDASASGQGLPH